MKLHKSVRKYYKFNLNQLDNLIELDSYQLLEFDSQTTQTDNTSNVKKAYFNYFGFDVIKYQKIAYDISLYKHKTNDTYLLIAKNNNTSNYIYLKSDLKTIHRDNKPATIVKKEHHLSNLKLPQQLWLTYYKDGELYNGCGPNLIYYTGNNLNCPFLYLERIEYNIGKAKNKLLYYHISNNNNHIESQMYVKKNGVLYFMMFEGSQIKAVEVFHNEYVLKREYDFLYHETRYYKKETDNLHRLNGPARISVNGKRVFKLWYINNEELPNDLFHYEKGKEKDITKIDILKAMLFDKEYGEFLQEKFNEQKTPQIN